MEEHRHPDTKKTEDLPTSFYGLTLPTFQSNPHRRLLMCFLPRPLVHGDMLVRSVNDFCEIATDWADRDLLIDQPA